MKSTSWPLRATTALLLLCSLTDAATSQGGHFVQIKSGVMSTLSFHPGWRQTWHEIVPIQLGGSYTTDLLFYDRVRGDAKFYLTDGKGGIVLKRHLTGWRKTWDKIIPGKFSGASNSPTDLLFYDAAAGLARFYRVNTDATITFLKEYNFQHWDVILPGNWGGSGFTDLFFYSRARGEAKIYRTDGFGNISLLMKYNFQKTWDIIVPGVFGGANGGTDLFFYNRVLGIGKFLGVDVAGKTTLLRDYPSLFHTWDEIISGSFDGQFNGDDLLFYDRTAGRYQVAFVTKGTMTYQPLKSTIKNHGKVISGWFGTNWGALLYDRTHYLRIHAVRCMNTNGSSAAAVSPAQVQAWVDKANETWTAAGIQFDFDPRTDFEEIRDDKLNQLDTCTHFKTQAECDAVAAHAASIAAREPCKITVFFRHGNETGATGGGFSSPNTSYVAMPGFNVTVTKGYYQDANHPKHGMNRQNIKLLAHELGHYLKAGGHTFAGVDYTGYSDPHAAVLKYMQTYNLKTADDMDGDRKYARDTPPDLGQSYYLLRNWNPADLKQEIRIQSTALGIDFTTNPDRHNVMSYFGICDDYLRVTAEQARNVRDWVHQPHRRKLLDPCSLPGLAVEFGKSCRSGQRHYVIGEPALRESVTYRVSGVPANASVTFIIGASNYNWGAIPLPMKLDPLGMTGCLLYTDLLVQIPLRANAAGIADARSIIPNDPNLVGTKLYSQFAVSFPRANPAGVTTTNAVETRFGG